MGGYDCTTFLSLEPTGARRSAAAAAAAFERILLLQGSGKRAKKARN